MKESLSFDYLWSYIITLGVLVRNTNLKLTNSKMLLNDIHAEIEENKNRN